MSGYVHAVTTSEKPTSILPPVQSTAGIPFIVGTAPVNMTDKANVNKPVLCYSYAEALAAFGYVAPVAGLVGETEIKKHEFTISEFMRSHFAFFQSAPVIILNVCDPETHTKKAETTSIYFDPKTARAVVAESGVLLDSVRVGTDSTESGKFTAAFDENGNLVLSALKNETGEYYFELGENNAVEFTADKLNPAAVTADQVINGIQKVDECYPRFRLVPGLLLAPYFSESPSVAAILAAKAAKINHGFQALALIDVPTNESTDDYDTSKYSGVPAWKNEKNIVDKRQVCLWPKVNNDGVIYALSTQAAGVICKTDGENDDVPYVSPSNKNISGTGSILDDGTEVLLDVDTAGYLNGQGVVTLLNVSAGWKLWGNRTACYPTNTDPKDSFIPVSRMFIWIANTLIQDYWSKLDAPLKRRQIDTILDSVNMWLNGLTAREFILGGRVEFLETENPTTDLMDGIARFHVYITPPSPNREIDFILEYDPEYLQTLFG